MPETDIALLAAAARQSGDIALQFFRRNPKVIDKPDGAGPVTAADLAVNAMLQDRLVTARPDYGWLSEETEDTTARMSTHRQFVVDPIDGTRAFIEGGKDWCHAIAVVENGQVVSAAVYLPVRDMLFTATVGGGAAMNGDPIRASAAHITGARVLGAKPNFDGRFWRGGMAPPIKQAFRSSLAYRLCLVGQGRFDGMLTLRPSWEWDIAAGALIASEAGARVTDQHNRSLQFNNLHPQVPGVLAAGPGLHANLADLLEPPTANP